MCSVCGVVEPSWVMPMDDRLLAESKALGILGANILGGLIP